MSGRRPFATSRTSDGLTSVVVGLHGYDETGVQRDVDANAFGPHSATPYLLRREHPGTPLVLVSAVVLSGDTVWPEAIANSVGLEIDGQTVSIVFADGTTAELRLGAATADGVRCIIRPTGGPEEVVRGD